MTKGSSRHLGLMDLTSGLALGMTRPQWQVERDNSPTCPAPVCPLSSPGHLLGSFITVWLLNN